MNFKVQRREQTGKGYNRRLRREGFASGIVYGKDDPIKISMRADYAFRLLKSLKGAKKAIELNIEADGKTQNKTALVQDYQLTNWGNKLLHVDFLEVRDDTNISTEVPIVLMNEDVCPAIKTGGVIQTVRRTIPVHCMVKDIPEFIEIDLKELQFGESIHVLDFEYPKGVSPIVTGRNFTLVTVAGRAAEEELTERVEASEGAEEQKEGAEEIKAE